MEEIRIDRYLWSVRLFKTRTLAKQACEKKHVFINNTPAKASKMIKEKDTIQLKKAAITYQYCVKKLLKNRIGAKLVDDYIENITSTKELEKIERIKTLSNVHMYKEKGRPTKKDRRILDHLLNE